jgi:DinB superfamily
MSRILCVSLLAKIDEQIERAAHLAGLLAEDRLDRRLGAPGGWTAGDLLGHLLDCMAGFCAALYAAEPQRLAHFQQLRELPVNLSISPKEFRPRVETYRARIAEGFALLEDDGLARSIPTVFVPAGVTLLTLLLGNLEHLINHKRQLFEFLKRTGVKVGTADLYRIRE